MKKKLPIGIEDFEKLRTENFYYVDKTALIRDLLNNWGEVNLFIRPRRFGKSLNMSMLKCFFEVGCNSSLFEGLEIDKEKELCENYMGKFPVIALSLKSVSGRSFETARSMLCAIIGSEAMRFQFLFDSDKLTEIEKRQYRALVNVDNMGHFVMSDEVLINSLLCLSSLLRKHYAQKVIVLVDEYDVPLERANQRGYYDLMAEVIRNLFNQTLKGNENLFFSILTGCLRVSKESIFTGLNNPQVFSITDVKFNEYFGFMDKEVRDMLSYYDLMSDYDTIKAWYDGYMFGHTQVYCPWDVINYCSDLCARPNAQPKAYWINTSGNEIVKRFIQMARRSTTKQEIENLIAGEAICKPIRQDLTYRDLDKNLDNLWSVLFTTGYLTQQGEPEGDLYELRIPNLEIRRIFVQQIYEWFQETAVQDGKTLSAFCEAFKNGDAEEVERLFNIYLMKTISIRDSFVRKVKKENFYHGILLGLLSYKENWSVSSNKETGDGYSDILVEIDDEETGIIIEVKYPDSNHLEKGCQAALEQIEKMDYVELLMSNGVKKILKYGIACYKKRCKVAMDMINNT